MREQPWGKKAIMTASTGWGQEEDKRRLKAAGFDHHLVKPIDLDVLERVLSSPAMVFCPWGGGERAVGVETYLAGYGRCIGKPTGGTFSRRYDVELSANGFMVETKSVPGTSHTVTLPASASKGCAWRKGRGIVGLFDPPEPGVARPGSRSTVSARCLVHASTLFFQTLCGD